MLRLKEWLWTFIWLLLLQRFSSLWFSQQGMFVIYKISFFIAFSTFFHLHPYALLRSSCVSSLSSRLSFRASLFLTLVRGFIPLSYCFFRQECEAVSEWVRRKNVAGETHLSAFPVEPPSSFLFTAQSFTRKLNWSFCQKEFCFWRGFEGMGGGQSEVGKSSFFVFAFHGGLEREKGFRRHLLGEKLQRL